MGKELIVKLFTKIEEEIGCAEESANTANSSANEAAMFAQEAESAYGDASNSCERAITLLNDLKDKVDSINEQVYCMISLPRGLFFDDPPELGCPSCWVAAIEHKFCPKCGCDLTGVDAENPDGEPVHLGKECNLELYGMWAGEEKDGPVVKAYKGHDIDVGEVFVILPGGIMADFLYSASEAPLYKGGRQIGTTISNRACDIFHNLGEIDQSTLNVTFVKINMPSNCNV